MLNKKLGFIAGITSLLITSNLSPLYAATPDGLGAYADQVVSFSQGTTKSGSPVLGTRSNPNASLGVAEQTNTIGTFTSLGFGGEIILKFENPVKDHIMIYEATNQPYPTESASVYISSDGNSFTKVGHVADTQGVSVPSGLCAHYVKILDTTNPNLHNNSADGFDLDAVATTAGEPCTTAEVPEFTTTTMMLAILMFSAGILYVKQNSLSRA